MIGPQGSVIVNQDGNINWSQVAEAWKNGGIRVRPTGGSAGVSGDHIAVDNKYKTAMCKYKTNHGYCKNGDSCIFAHSSSELRAKNFDGNGNMMMEGGSRNMAKTAMCKYQANYGNCKNGDSCIFAHSSSELRPKNFGGNGNEMMMEVRPPLNMAKKKRDNAKTVLCQNYSKYGKCKFGNNCSYAHGPGELRHLL